jgi:tellurite resistance protein TerB
MNIIEKLQTEIIRYQSKPFLKAAMAVCALTALADDDYSLSERAQVDTVLQTMSNLNYHDPHKAAETFEEFVHYLRTDHGKASEVLVGKIVRFAGNYKEARTLLRIAGMIINADGKVTEEEQGAFDELCGVIGVDPYEVWDKLSAAAE